MKLKIKIRYRHHNTNNNNNNSISILLVENQIHSLTNHLSQYKLLMRLKLTIIITINKTTSLIRKISDLISIIIHTGRL